MSAVIVATDLDLTLIYSRRTLARWGGSDAVAAVETYQDVDASFMTAAAAARFATLHEHAVVVPTTTRTPEQLARVRLPGPAPRYAVAANGGVLLVDAVPDPAWTRAVTSRLDGAGLAGLAEVHRYATTVCAPHWTKLVRTASDLFCYAVLDRDRMPADFPAETSAWAAERGWQVSVQGRKIYWVPRGLTKSAAVAEVARRCGVGRLLAAGDSLLDQDLLEAADAGVLARHGELAESGWSAAHVDVTARCGVDAGAEIVDWFAARLGG